MDAASVLFSHWPASRMSKSSNNTASILQYYTAVKGERRKIGRLYQDGLPGVFQTIQEF